MIEVNDIVCVNFNNSQYTLCKRAMVLYVPLSSGESWIFRDEENGVIHMVSEPCTVSLVEKYKFDGEIPF